jgi:hypothetical protein
MTKTEIKTQAQIDGAAISARHCDSDGLREFGPAIIAGWLPAYWSLDAEGQKRTGRDRLPIVSSLGGPCATREEAVIVAQQRAPEAHLAGDGHVLCVVPCVGLAQEVSYFHPTLSGVPPTPVEAWAEAI